MSPINRPGQRLAVVGNGMAAGRLLEELAGLGALSSLDVTVIGDEPHPAYNRVLLSSVLAGAHSTDAIVMRTRSWYDGLGVQLLTGMRATEIDRDARLVHLADGTAVPYDRLVLATGSSPVLPPIRGVIQPDHTMHPRVFAFRTLDDCTDLVDSLEGARSAIVVGGGLLGLEAARGLAERGLTVDIVEVAEHLMHNQLDTAPGHVLRRVVERLGIGVHTGVKAVGLVGDGERVEGVRMDDGFVLDGDLVVLACGVRPNVSLARMSGLDVRRGIVVDDRLASQTDPSVHAIGDCAEHRGLVPGLVAPAWDQAAVLARVIAGDTTARYDGSRLVQRLRASNLDVAVVGVPQAEPGDEVVEFANPLRGVYRRLVVRAGRLHGAVLLGDLDIVGLLVQYFDRGAPLPPDPSWQLLGNREDAIVPLELPDEAELCTCNSVSVGTVRACIRAGAATVADVAADTRATTGCGGCAGAVATLLDETAVIA
jgi:assimilatory nitrate reductase electron transfer subunit